MATEGVEKTDDYVGMIEGTAAALRQEELKKQSKVTGIIMTVVFSDGSSSDVIMCEPGYNLQLLGASNMTLLGMMGQLVSKGPG